MRINRKGVNTVVQAGDRILTSNAVDGVTNNTSIAAFEQYLLGLAGDRKVPVEDQIDFTSTEPVIASGVIDGNRYINTATGVGSVTGIEVVANDIMEVRDSSWYAITPVEGWSVWDKSEDKHYFFTGTSWNQEKGNSVIDTLIASGGEGTMSLTHTPTTTYPYQLFINGLLQLEGTQYTLSGSTITFIGGTPTLTAADVVVFYYDDITSPRATNSSRAEAFEATAGQTEYTVAASAIADDGLWSIQVEGEFWNSTTGITSFTNGNVSIVFATGVITFLTPLSLGSQVIIKYN